MRSMSRGKVGIRSHPLGEALAADGVLAGLELLEALRRHARKASTFLRGIVSRPFGDEDNIGLG